MDAISLLTLATLVWKAVDLVKNANARRWDPVLTQVLVWVVGTGVAFLAASANVTDGIPLWGTSIGAFNAASLVLFGLMVGSFASATVDVKKALDRSDSAAQPTLLDQHRPV